MSRVYRSAMTGRFVAPEVADADPDRHVAQTVRHAPPDITVERMNGHFLKIHVGDGRVLHHFSGADGPDSDFHDHPFAADIIVLAGGYVEQVMSLDRPHDPPQEIERREGDRFRNEAGTIHRIIHLTAPFCITQFRPGPHERTPGFYQFRPDGAWHRLWHDPDWHHVA